MTHPYEPNIWHTLDRIALRDDFIDRIELREQFGQWADDTAGSALFAYLVNQAPGKKTINSVPSVPLFLISVNPS